MTLEHDLQILLKGFEDEAQARLLGDRVTTLLSHLAVSSEPLDFRRMHRIIITNDFAGELAEMQGLTESGNPIEFTNEDYAVCVAKVMQFRTEDEFEIVPVINAGVAANLLSEDDEAYGIVLHMLHHEFCHVHDDNKKIDILRDYILHHRWTGKDIFIRPLAEVLWSEYFANRTSAPTAVPSFTQDMIGSFADALERTKPDLDQEITAYRYHADLERVMSHFQRHGEFLAKSAAYVLGYLDGFQSELSEQSSETDNTLRNSYFEDTWHGMATALRNMYAAYPDNWQGLAAYDELANVVEEYYARLGLVLSTTDDGQAYVDVPF